MSFGAAFYGVAVLLVLVTAAARGRHAEGRLVALGVVVSLVLTLAACWRSVVAPVAADTLPLRIGYARFDPFGDWNHPALPYLLNLPARISAEAWVARLGPLAWLGMLVVTMHVHAARVGGALAGAFAGVWIASEARRRVSVESLGDWDLAGFVLVAILAWSYDRSRGGTRGAWVDALEVSALSVLAVGSSHLLWVVVLGWCLVLAGAAARGQVSWVLVLASLSGPLVQQRAFRAALDIGSDVRERALFAPETISLHTLLPVTPVGRTWWMGPVLLLAVARALRRWSHVDGQLALVALLGVPAALVVAASRVHLNGAYYLELVVPVALVLGAVELVQLSDRCLGSAGSRGALWAFLVAALTVSLPDKEPDAPWVGQLPALARGVVTEDRPLVTNQGGLDVALAYRAVQLGLLPATPRTLGLNGPPLDVRVWQTRCVDCLADPACVTATREGWSLWFLPRDQTDEAACVGVLTAGCIAVPREGGAPGDAVAGGPNDMVLCAGRQ